MVGQGNYPLVIDEPEHHVSNRYVYESFVERIRDLKTRRQIICITHSGNLVVLGDAEQVVVMSMATPTQAAPPRVGTVDECRDEILVLCEGGEEAFKRRAKRYGL